MKYIFLYSFAVFAFITTPPTSAAEVNVAVAANFIAPMKKIAAVFEQDTHHKAILSFGSTGTLYSQIKHGAPFQILLAADHVTPARIEQEGLGIPGTRFTYATGKLALWSKQPNQVDQNGKVLQSEHFDRIAIAHPKLAPYGIAAIETLTQLGLIHRLQSKFVQGENIAQTYQFVATENVPLGFIALSQIYANGKITEGSAWIVPDHLYRPIKQDAILLTPGKDNPAALALVAYLRSDKARSIILSYGYEIF